MIFEKLFNREKTNFGRQYEIDFLRGFAVILLIICHTGYFLSSSNSGMFYFCDLIGSEPVAPVLMALMGISMVFSRKQTALCYLKRGIIFLILSYILNLFRSFPYWFVGELDYFACEQGFFVVDIFQFVGLSFLLFALFKAIKLPSWAMFIISIVFLIIGQILMSNPSCLNFSNKSTFILNLFLPIDNDWCCFNLLTWFIYPCFGLMIGELIIRCKNKNIFYLILLIVGSVGVAVLYISIFTNFSSYTDYYYGGNFYRMGIFNTLITLLYFCFCLAFWFFCGKILLKTVKNILNFLSKNITFIYIASWIEISIIFHLQAYYKIDFHFMILIAIMILVLISCSFASILYNKIKKKNNKIQTK